MKHFAAIVLGFLFLFAPVAGSAGEPAQAATKQLSIVGIYTGTIYVSDAEGFSSKPISIVITDQPGSSYMFKGYIAGSPHTPFYGFLRAGEFVAYGEHLELEGQFATSGKKVKSMALFIGHTGDTPSCMAADSLLKKK